MTVSTTTTKVSYSGDAATTDFAFTFSCLSPSDIDVFIDNAELFIGVVVTLNSDQSANPGGSVEITPAPTSGAVIDIVRATLITQETDYNAYDPFPAETHEQALDRLTLICQDIDDSALIVVAPPATASSAGKAGTVAYDSDYLYVCVALDTWKRVLLETW